MRTIQVTDEYIAQVKAAAEEFWAAALKVRVAEFPLGMRLCTKIHRVLLAAQKLVDLHKKLSPPTSGRLRR